ncbi:MAG: type II toxin-antitoxin system RelE/ParE family toxin [Candidatus Nezhaarchaeales archaeon]
MTKFRILLHRRAHEYLSELNPKDRRCIIDKLKQLEDFPNIQLDIVKIAGEANTFRLRVGKYRALFKVYEQEKIIVIAKIDTRKRIYQ